MRKKDQILTIADQAGKDGVPETKKPKSNISLTDPERFLSAFYEAPPRPAKRPITKGRRFWMRVFVFSGLLASLYLWVGEGDGMHQGVFAFMEKNLYIEVPQIRVIDRISLLFSNGGKSDEPEFEENMLSCVARRLEERSMESKEAAAFDRVLSRCEKQFSGDVEYQEDLALLKWIQALERYFEERPLDAPIEMFADEELIEIILNTWRQRKPAIQALLNRLEILSDGAFSQRNVYRRVYRLIDIELLYVRGIEELKAEIQKRIENQDFAEIAPLLATFKRRFPGVRGLAAVEADLNEFMTRYDAYMAGRTQELCDKAGFETPLFSERRRFLCLNALPPKDPMTPSSPGKTTIAISDLTLDTEERRP